MQDIGISIIVPIYNSEKYLAKCLNSLMEISEQDEVILINDGSTDSSLSICEEYSKYNNQIKVITKKNGGVSSARNLGIDNSKKKYITFMDADDYYVTGWRKIIEDGIEYFNQADVLTFSNKVPKKILDKNQCTLAAIGNDKANRELNGTMNWAVSKIYSRDLIFENNIRFKNLINGEDTLFNCYVFLNANQLVNIDKSIYIYNKNFDSSTNTFNHNLIKNEYLFHKYLKELYQEYQLYDSFWNSTYEKTLLTGIFSILYKLALSKDKTNLSSFIELCNREEYSSALTNLKVYKNDLNVIVWIILLEIKRGKINTGLLITKEYLFLKRAYYKIKKNSIEEKI